MITKQQYLEALDIVESYHKQLKEHGVGHSLTPILEWNKFYECSRRLQNILKDIKDGLAHCAGGYYKEEYIENLKIHKMKNSRNCGKQSLDEFIELRGY